MVDEHILKQLDNDSNVIGYQPKLEYKKERTAVGKAITSEDVANYDPEKDTTLYTKTLNGFANNMPSSVLSDIDYVLKNMKRLKNNLAERFKEEQALLNNPFYSSDSSSYNNNPDPNDPSSSYEPYLPSIDPKPGEPYNPYNDINQFIDAGESGNTNFTDQFKDQYDTPTGSVIPALIDQITDLENILSKFKDVYSDTFYNKPTITIPEAKEIDDSYLKDMKSRERHKTNGSINYLTISFDGLLNKMVSYSVFQNNKSAIKIAKVIDSHDDVQATSNDMNIVNKLFKDVNDELDIRSRGYMRNEDFQLIQKSMYNYYEKRKELNDIYGLFRKNPDNKFLARKVMEYSSNLRNSIKNVSRVLLYNQNYLNQIANLETQKYNIQKISRSTSSNS